MREPASLVWLVASVVVPVAIVVRWLSPPSPGLPCPSLVLAWRETGPLDAKESASAVRAGVPTHRRRRRARVDQGLPWTRQPRPGPPTLADSKKRPKEGRTVGTVGSVTGFPLGMCFCLVRLHVLRALASWQRLPCCNRFDVGGHSPLFHFFFPHVVSCSFLRSFIHPLTCSFISIH